MLDLKTIFIENPQALKFNESEALSYLRLRTLDCETRPLFDECTRLIYESSSPKVVYGRTNIEVSNGVVDFEFFKVNSDKLSLCLKDCKEAYIFAATLGISVDRLIEKYSKISQSKAAVCDAIASALIEGFCDYVNKNLSHEKVTVPRFSPGYGDFDLKHQRDILSLLDANRKIGITLTETNFMLPTKTVTAIIGIKEGKGNNER